ncbi:DNA gyrase inhibitor [Klebsiella michiganensis]|nr:DNA gyrase inhibitor [Klebsiella michiganensis]
MTFKVQHVPARKVAGFHLVGPWETTVPQGFGQLAMWAKTHGLNGDWLAVYYDDPDVVPAAKLRVDTVLGVPEEFKLPENSEGVIVTAIEADTYAIGHAIVKNEAFQEAWETFFDQVEADGGYRLTGKPCYEIYLNDGSASGVWEIDMYIPVAKV